MPGIFLGLKFQACVSFWVMYTLSTPAGSAARKLKEALLVGCYVACVADELNSSIY